MNPYKMKCTSNMFLLIILIRSNELQSEMHSEFTFTSPCKWSHSGFVKTVSICVIIATTSTACASHDDILLPFIVYSREIP